jgi:hypothetical protein
MKYSLVVALIFCSASLVFSHGDIGINYHYFDSKKLVSKPQLFLWETLLKRQDQIKKAIDSNNFNVIENLVPDLQLYFNSFAAIKIHDSIDNYTKKSLIRGAKSVARISKKYPLFLESENKEGLIKLSKKLDSLIHYYEGILPELKNRTKEKKGEKNV